MALTNPQEFQVPPPRTEDERLDAAMPFATTANRTDDGSLDYLVHIDDPDEYEQRSKNKPIRLMSEREIRGIIQQGQEHPNWRNATNELLLRRKWNTNSLYDNLTDLDYVKEKAGRLVGQGVAGFTDIPGTLVGLSALTTVIPETGLRLLGVWDDKNPSPTKALLQNAREWLDWSNKVSGTSDPRDQVETLFRIAPAAMIPIARGRQIKGIVPNVLEVVTPFTIGGGKGRVAANVGVQFGMDEAFRSFFGDRADEYETVFERLVPPAEAAQPQTPDPTVAETDVGTNVRLSDFSSLYAAGLLFVGAAVAPRAVKKLASFKTTTPTVRDLKSDEAPPNAQSIEKVSDLVKTNMLGPDAGMKAIINRAGIDPDALARLEANIDQTHAQLRGATGAALRNGELETLGTTYKVPVSVSRMKNEVDALPPDQRAMANEYVLLHDMLDDFAETARQAAKDPTKKPFNVVQGKTLRETHARIGEIEQAFPQVLAIHGRFKQATAALRETMQDGTKSSLLTAKRRNELDQERSNYVPFEALDILPTDPWTKRVVQRANKQDEVTTLNNTETTIPFLQKRDVSAGEVPRSDPFDVIEAATHNTVLWKQKNHTRLEIIDEMLNSQHGQNSIKLIKPKEYRKALDRPEKNPWINQVQTVWRNGDKEYYWMSRHLYDMTHFDANATRSTWWHGSSNVFRTFTTGLGAPWFAVRSFLREGWTGATLTPEGRRSTGITGPPIGLSSGLYRSTQNGLSNAIYRTLDSGNGKVLRTIAGAIAPRNPEAFLKTWADKMSASYIKSSYYAGQQQHAFRASWMESGIKQADSALKEAIANVKAPYTMKVFGAAYRNILQNLHEANRISFFARNWEPGMTKQQLAKLAQDTRSLTGDVSQAGQVFRQGGKQRIGVQPAKEGTLTNLALLGARGVGSAAHGLRTAAPFVNPMIKEFEKLGKLYWQNPLRFTTRLGATVMMPQLASYTMASLMGPEYTKYMMELRDERTKSLFLYVPIPGRAPEDGVEIPLPFSLAIPGYLALQSLDHTLRGNDLFTHSEQMIDAFSSVLENHAGVMFPPLAATAMGFMGVKTPGNLVFSQGESAYRPKQDPHSSFPVNLELMIKSQLGAAGDVFIHGINSYMEEGDITDAMSTIMQQVERRTDIIADKRIHTMTRVGEATFAIEKDIERLLKIYDAWLGPAAGQSRKRGAPTPGRQTPLGVTEGLTSVTNTLLGIQKTPKPTNPLYIAFADELKRRFGTDAEGFLFLKKHRAFLTDQLRSLRPINTGNLQNWQERVTQSPELMQIMSANNLKLSSAEDTRALMNLLEKERHTTNTKLLTIVREIEEAMGVRLKDLDPYDQ